MNRLLICTLTALQCHDTRIGALIRMVALTGIRALFNKNAFEEGRLFERGRLLEGR